MLSETFRGLDPWYAFIGEEFDDITLFNFHHFGTFCHEPTLLAKLPRWPVSTVFPFTRKPWIS
jgi:hypothetical protein